MPPKPTKTKDPTQIVVQLDREKFENVGARMSSRLKVDYIDEDGKEVKGFFTKNTFANSYKKFVDVRQDFEEKYGKEPFYPLFEMLFAKAGSPIVNNLYGKIVDKGRINRVASEENRHVDLVNVCFRVGNPELSQKSLLAYFNDLATQDINSPNLEKKEKAQKLMEIIQGMRGNSKDEFNNEDVKERREAFFTSLSELFNSIEAIKTVTRAQLDVHGISQNANVNKRNNAMYEYAKLLGYPDLMAKSVPMTLVHGNKVVSGSYMLHAKGVEKEKMFDPKNPEFNGKQMVIAASGKKQLSNMQILDFLCGNVDRHGKNMFYQYEVDGDKVKLVGVQGIDNDASFGVVQYKGAVDYTRMSPIEDIDVIDKEMAEKIMNLDKDEMENIIRLAGLSENEIDAAFERLNALQQKIKSKDGITILDGEEAWDNLDLDKYSNRNPNKGKVYVKEAGPGKNVTKDNIFALTNDNVATYEFLKQAPNIQNVEEKGEVLDELALGQAEDMAVNPIMDDTKDSNVVTCNEEFALEVKSQEMQDFTDTINELIKQETVDTPRYKPLQKSAKKLNEMLKAITDYAKKDGLHKNDYGIAMLDDYQRNTLADAYTDLIKECDKLISLPPKKGENIAIPSAWMHLSKNLKVYAKQAKAGMLSDAMEAEKKAFLRLQKKFEKDRRLARERFDNPDDPTVQQAINEALKEKYAPEKLQAEFNRENVKSFAQFIRNASKELTVKNPALEYEVGSLTSAVESMDKSLDIALLTNNMAVIAGELSSLRKACTKFVNNVEDTKEGEKPQEKSRLSVAKEMIKLTSDAIQFANNRTLNQMKVMKYEPPIVANELVQDINEVTNDKPKTQAEKLSEKLNNTKRTFLWFTLSDSKEMKRIKACMAQVVGMKDDYKTTCLEARIYLKKLQEATKDYIDNNKKTNNNRKAVVREINEMATAELQRLSELSVLQIDEALQNAGNSLQNSGVIPQERSNVDLPQMEKRAEKNIVDLVNEKYAKLTEEKAPAEKIN